MSWFKKESWSKEDIIEYYHGNEFAYSIWGQNMHYGYWKKGNYSLRKAALQLNIELANRLNICKDDHVLDAGCGVGGNAIYLAKTFGCSVVGITITPRQIELATQNAKKAGVDHLCTFMEMDYMNTSFEDNTFSVVLGLESICYATPEDKFTEEVSRILNDDGRFGMADAFSSFEEFSGSNERLMNRWLDGWLVTTLPTSAKWTEHVRANGFKSVEYRDITKEVWPTSVIMLITSLPFLPLHLLEKFIPLRAYPTDALFHQFFALKKGLWEYGIFVAQK